MKERINEEILCVLKKNNQSNQVEVDYVPIETQFKEFIGILSELCDDSNSTLNQVINFIKSLPELDDLTKYYDYCDVLYDSDQGFRVSNQSKIIKIIESQESMLHNQKYNNVNNLIDHIKEDIADCKKEIKTNYIYWIKAYSINKSYELCREDGNILTFSHRMVGWSNPTYKLTTNFSVQIRTNFGYGRVSYFFTSLKYKNIEITPFSEWIEYEFAKFSEIIRYSRSHILKNEYWLEAMEFSRDACNLSITDEAKFVEKYIVDECEKMVIGLEEIFCKDKFIFKSRGKIERNTVEKKGNDLVMYRGEKISGALDFISKIIKFENITTIKSFINRIENCNKKIQPILLKESEKLKIKISDLTEEINALKPKYDNVIQKNNDFIIKKTELRDLMVTSRELNIQYIDHNKLEIAFQKEYSLYNEFKEEYKKVTDTFKIITIQIQNLTKVYDKIISYNNKIIVYFG